MAEQNMKLEFDAEPLRELLGQFQAVVADAAALGRIADASERIADALEVSNAASLGQISMDPASPGALRLVQVVTDVIVKRLQEMNRRNQQLG